MIKRGVGVGWPTYNLITRAEKEARTKTWLKRQWLETKWSIERKRLMLKFFWSILCSARTIELELQRYRQMKNNLAHANLKEDYLFAAGFCRGIEYMIYGEWKR